MSNRTPGKSLVVFVPLKRAEKDYYFSNDPLDPDPVRAPWVAEVSSVPPPKTILVHYDAALPKHPERYLWWSRAPGPQPAAVWSSERALWVVVKGSVFVPDLDVYSVPVALVTEWSPDLRQRSYELLSSAVAALDLPEAPRGLPEERP